MSIPETFLFASLVLTFGASAQSELTPIAAGESVEKTVGQRLCFAGRFSVLTAAGDDGRSKLRCLEQVSSSAGHPNAAKLDEVVIVLRPDSLFRPEAGRAHCLILMEGSKSSLSVVGFGPDDVATFQTLERVMHSLTAFQNDRPWQDRRALWAKFRKDVRPNEHPSIYAEDDRFEHLLYSITDSQVPFPLHLYDARSGKSRQIVPAKAISGMNRITYQNDQFLVWFDDSVELTIDPRHGE
jgi:hypothetical protein